MARTGAGRLEEGACFPRLWGGVRGPRAAVPMVCLLSLSRLGLNPGPGRRACAVPLATPPAPLLSVLWFGVLGSLCFLLCAAG